MDTAEENALLGATAFEAIAQHDTSGSLTELVLRSPYPVVAVADIAKAWASLTDLCC